MTLPATLIDLGRDLVTSGLVRGTAGNISISDAAGSVVLSPSGFDLGALTPETVSQGAFADDGSIRHVSGPPPTKEAPIHAAFHRRTGAGTIVHTHSFHAVQASCLPPWSEHCAVPPFTPYFPMKIGNCPLVPYRHPGDPDLGALIDAITVDFRAVLLAHHGLVVWAPTPAEAIAMTVELEDACRLMVGLAGTPEAQVLPARAVAELAARSGMPWGSRPS